MAVEFWEFLCRTSWNPIFGAIVSALAALAGAYIGGHYVLRAMEKARERDRFAAGRALSAELELNFQATVTLAIGGREDPDSYLTFRPPLARRVFDDRLTALSELLMPSEFRSLVALYAGASASFLLLETQAQRRAPFTPGAMGKFSEYAQEFAVAARVIAGRVWPLDEQQRLNIFREKLLREMRVKVRPDKV